MSGAGARLRSTISCLWIIENVLHGKSYEQIDSLVLTVHILNMDKGWNLG